MGFRLGTFVAVLFAVLVWSAPADAQRNCFCGRPPEANVFQGLLAESFTPADASAAFTPGALAGATLAIIPSSNFNEYSRRWTRWFEEGAMENHWAYQLTGQSRDSMRGQEQNTDPRRFADQLVAALEPHVAEVMVASDFQTARDQGATFYLVVDAWLGTPNGMNGSWKTWAGATLLDGSLQRVWQANGEHQVRRESGLFESVVVADARQQLQSYEGATQPVLAALQERLGSPSTQ